MRVVARACPKCDAAVSETARFCERCASFVGRRCPACDAMLSAAATFCDSCGTSLAGPAAAASAPLPVQGELKRLTVLFADLAGSTALLTRIGAERGRWLIEAVIARMRAAVEAFGGIVNDVNGDGVMALFGVPRGLEDHALRACHAALRMRALIQGQPFPEAAGHPIAIRIGLHSGEVVVTEGGSALDPQYRAFGVAAHTAARMEQTSQPGQIRLSASTYASVAGQVEVEHPAPIRAKGLDEPVDTYLLLGVPDHAAPKRGGGGAPFIGREIALASLGFFAAAARDDASGNLVVVTGEAGSGKSRLCRELLDRETAFRVLRTGGVPFLPRPPYGAVTDCLRACAPSGVWTPNVGTPNVGTPNAGAPKVGTGDALRSWLESLGAATPDHVRALLALLAADAPADPAWTALSYRERQERIADAVGHILRRLAEERPLLLFIDDLQWIDEASTELIAALPRRIADARVFVLANARADGLSPAVAGSGAAVVALDTFSRGETEHFLRFVLAPAPVSAETAARLFQLTGGNAFFLEEMAQALRADGPLGEEGLEAELPATVQDLLTMRIDHLSAGAKAALQAAAVLGMDMERDHLAALMGLTGDAVAAVARELRNTAFLLPGPVDATDAPAREGGERLAFRHVLARDAAYSGLLRENRRHLHANALAILEGGPPGDGPREPGVLAFHATRCGNWPKAFRYGEAAGHQAIARAAPREAIRFFDAALDALGQTPSAEETKRAELALRFQIRNTLFSLGRARDIGPHLLAARALSESLGDAGGQARALCQSAHHAWQMANWSDALALGENARAVSDSIGDLGLRVSSVFFMGLAAYSLGRFRYGADLLGHNVASLPGELATERFGFVSVCSVVSGSYLAICLTELGLFDDAERAALRARDAAQRAGSAFDRIQADLALAGVALARGEAADRIPLLEEALALCRRASVAVLLPRTTSALALALALSGRPEEAAALAAERPEQSGEAVRAMSLLASAEALLLSRHLEDAGLVADKLVRFAADTRQPAAAAWGRAVLASVHLAGGRCREAAAEAAIAHATALSHEMRPLALRTALVAALAWANGGADDDRHDDPHDAATVTSRLGAAISACEAAGLAAWVPRTLGLVPAGWLRGQGDAGGAFRGIGG